MQSTRNVGKSNPSNFLTGSTNNCCFSSSPDLPSLVIDTRTVRELHESEPTPERITTLQRGSTCTRRNVQFDKSSNQDHSLKTLGIDRKIGPHETPVDTLDSSITPDEMKSREIGAEKNRSIIPSPKCLGIPVSLPHSVSSPDLPEPLKATILDCSRPLVTLHSNSLASSVVSPTLCGSYGSGRSDKTENISLTSRTSSTLLPMSLQTSQNKRYGRSKSALTLSTGNDPRGESGPLKNTFPMSRNPYNRSNIDNSDSLSCYKCGMTRFSIYESQQESKKSKFENSSNFHSACSASGGQTNLVHDHSTSLPARLRAFNRRSSLNEVTSDSAGTCHSPFNRRCTSLNLAVKKRSASSDGDFLRRHLRFTERSRSLSPSSQECLCYNCNVSILIQQSVNLPPDERSNFETYFLRSLSHKLINCCSYKMSVEAANASRRASRSASPNFITRSSFTPSNLDDLSFERSQLNSDAHNASKFKRNRRFSDEPSGNRLIDRRRIKELVDEPFDPHESRIIRHKSLPSFLTHKCNLQKTNPRDLSLAIGQTNLLRHENSASKTFNEISDHVLLAEKPLSPIPVDPKLSYIIDHRNYETGEKSLWVLSMKSRNIVSDAVLPNIEFDSEERSDPRTVAGRKTTAKRSLTRQSSCPSGLIDPSMLAYNTKSDFPNCCNYYESILDGNDDIDLFANQQNRLSTCRINGPISSPRFLSPPLRVDQRPKSFLFRKFSCPIIIAESSDSPETSRTQAISAHRESPHTNRSAASSVSNYRQGFHSMDEPQYVENEQLSMGGKFDNNAHKKSLRRQASYPETIGNASDSNSSSLSRFSVNPSKLSNCCEDPSSPSTANCCQETFGTRFKFPSTRCICFCHDDQYDFDRNANIVRSNDHMITNARKMKYAKTLDTYHENPKYTLSPNSSSSHPRLQTQRSFSSPDTRPSIIQQPDPTCTAKRHRHSISGQMSYFKLLGYNVSKKLTGSTNSLFSTAVISGSSSAPNLKDMVPPHASAVAGKLQRFFKIIFYFLFHCTSSDNFPLQRVEADEGNRVDFALKAVRRISVSFRP